MLGKIQLILVGFFTSVLIVNSQYLTVGPYGYSSGQFYAIDTLDQSGFPSEEAQGMLPEMTMPEVTVSETTAPGLMLSEMTLDEIMALDMMVLGVVPDIYAGHGYDHPQDLEGARYNGHMKVETVPNETADISKGFIIPIDDVADFKEVSAEFKAE
jgi:hypothetical protein